MANKVDLDDQRLVAKADAEKLASEHKINFYETSAKTGLGLEECMDDIIH